ncbi:Stress response protein nst1 [Basidiobolus ranarum]|uniref:Stress response protein NST1 n=1 Tax=Basidiobolus ranarum TaxID=34480 RepID=A0ABR2VMF6_9FUNG
MSRTCSDGSADDSSLVSSSSGDPTKAVIYNRNGTKCITIVKTQVSPSQPEEGCVNLELPSGHTTSTTKKKKRKNKKSLDYSEEESLVANSYSGGDEILLETHSTTSLPQERNSLSCSDKQSGGYSQTTAPKVKPPAQHKNAGKKDDGIWSIDIEEERKRIRTFWLQLSEEERKTLVKVERNTVLKKMREQKNRVCPCSICGKRRKKAQEARGASIDVRYNRDSGDNHQDPTAKSLETDEYSDEEEAMVYPPPNVYLDLENDLKIEEDGMVTVADDLIKNDGEKFLVMMEKLAEQQVELKEPECETNGCCEEHGPKETGLYDEEEEKLDMTTKGSIEETCTGQSSPEDQRLEDRHIFQVLIARLFEQQVLQAYREKVANERQQRLLGEIEEEIRLKREKEEIRLKKKEKKKDKKRLSKERKEQLRLKNESEQLARAESAKAQKEEEKKKKDEEQQRRIKEKLQKEQERVQQEEVTREILKVKEIARLKMALQEKLKDETNQHKESEKRDTHFDLDELTSQACLQASTRNSSPETTNQVGNGNSLCKNAAETSLPTSNSINNNGEVPHYPVVDALDNSATDELPQVAASPCIRPFYQQTAQSSSSTIGISDFNKATLHQFPISRGVPFETSDPFIHAKNEASQIGVALGGGQGLGFGLLTNGSNDHAYPGFSLPTWNSNAGVDTKVIRPPKSKAVSRPASSRKFSHDLGSAEPTSRDFNALSSTTSSFSLAHIWDSPSKDDSSSPSQLSSASPVQESSFFTDHLFTGTVYYILRL